MLYLCCMTHYVIAYNINERNDPSNDPSFAMTSQAISDTSRFGIMNVVGRDQININMLRKKLDVSSLLLRLLKTCPKQRL